MLVRRILTLTALVALSACSGGGGSSLAPAPPANPGSGSSAPQSAYVTPSFTFAIPASASTSSSSRRPDFVGAGAQGVTITLVSSSVGLSNVAVSSSLTGTNCTTAGGVRTCTVAGPPVPPGTDVFSVVAYDTAPTGSPLAEPGTAKALSQTTSTATTPATGNPSFTIVAGTSPALTITLFGIPAKFSFPAITAQGTPGTATGTLDNPSAVAAPQVQDAAGDPITGTFSAPVTLTDSDTSGAQGTQLTNGTTTGSTLTFTTGGTTGNLSATITYGGLAIASPSITASAPSATSASQTYTIKKATLTLSPVEIDLYNPTGGGTGNTGSFTASEIGWSNAPYSRTFTSTPVSCTSGTAATVYALTTTNNLTFTDTVPATPAAGVCTVSIGGDLQGNTATETLTYTTGSFTVNGKGRSNR